MECDQNGQSDERIGEALIKEVMEGELRASISPVLVMEREQEQAPALPLSTELQSEPEQKLVTQMAKMMRIVGDRLKDDVEFQDAVDGMIRSPGGMTTKFLHLTGKLFEHGQVTWERIIVLFYVAGRMAVKVMEDHLPALVTDIYTLTVDFFRTKLLAWVQGHGGWINSLSELCQRVQGVRPMSQNPPKIFLIFIAGLAVGSIITWKLQRGT